LTQQHQAASAPVGRRQLVPIYGAGFTTAFGAHAVAADLGPYTVGHHDSLFQLGLPLGVYDAAEVVLKPVFGAVVDRKGAKPVMVGGLLAFAVASAAFVAGGVWVGIARRCHRSAGAGVMHACKKMVKTAWW
jgi:MFS family permease